MLKNFRRRAGLALAMLLAIVAGLLVSPASPAHADSGVLSCDYPGSWDSLPWQSASWGRAKLCEIDGLANDGVTNGGVWFKVETQDILTDGWCVKVQYQYGGVWYDAAGSQSCGGVVESAAVDPPTDWSVTNIRLVRGQCTSPYTPGICVNYKNIYDL